MLTAISALCPDPLIHRELQNGDIRILFISWNTFVVLLLSTLGVAGGTVRMGSAG